MRKGTELKKIGYWYSEEEPHLPWPKPTEYIDGQKEIIAQYLISFERINHYMGCSSCRICGKHNNGASEYSDGTYLWPEGLAHYVLEHNTKLPEHFLNHILEKLKDVDLRTKIKEQIISNKKLQEIMPVKQKTVGDVWAEKHEKEYAQKIATSYQLSCIFRPWRMFWKK